MFPCPEAFKKFCEPTRYAESDDPRIIKLARKITKKDKTPKQAARSIFRWVRDNYLWDIKPIVGARRLLERREKRALCTDKTNLFIALCRAVGIPARYVLADCWLKIRDKELPRKSKHIYAEVWTGKEWEVADPSFGKGSEKLFQICVFGKPSWTRVIHKKRMRSLSPLLVFIVNLIMKYSSFSRVVREEMRKVGYGK